MLAIKLQLPAWEKYAIIHYSLIKKLHKMQNQQGGRVQRADAKAQVKNAKKSALVAVPVPDAPTNPVPFKASTIDEAIKGLKVSFKVNLRQIDGTSSREVLAIESLGDFEEPALVLKSATLRELNRQKEFLQQFQDELQKNRKFKKELEEILTPKKRDGVEAFNTRDELVRFLKDWMTQLKSPSPEFLKLLNPNYSPSTPTNHE